MACRRGCRGWHRPQGSTGPAPPPEDSAPCPQHPHHSPAAALREVVVVVVEELKLGSGVVGCVWVDVGPRCGFSGPLSSCCLAPWELSHPLPVAMLGQFYSTKFPVRASPRWVTFH